MTWYMQPEAFQKSTWWVSPQSVRICVTEGWRNDEWEPELKWVIESSLDNESSLVEMPVIQPVRYIYVALWLDRIYVKLSNGVWVCTRKEHHVTLAYLPHQEWREYRRISSQWIGLGSTMNKWMGTRPTPTERPLALLHFRHTVDNRKEVPIPTPIVELTMDDIQSGSISLCTPTGDEDLLGAVRRYHKRDCRRVQEVQERCSKMQVFPRDAFIRCQLCEGRITPGTEIADLLSFLHDRLVFRFGVFHMKPREQVGLLDLGRWHVTPQTESNNDVVCDSVAENLSLALERSSQPVARNPTR